MSTISCNIITLQLVVEVSYVIQVNLKLFIESSKEPPKANVNEHLSCLEKENLTLGVYSDISGIVR